MRRATRPRRLKSRRCVFLSTLSLRRATNLSMLYNAVKSYFYPRSPCGERPLTPARMSSRLPISIHALLAESDNSSYGALDGASISIHALLAESDWQAGAMQLPTAPFLSTLSLRRATAAALLLGKNYVKFLSTLSLRRATIDAGTGFFVLDISIHALLAESDLPPHQQKRSNRISIHALLAESDLSNTVLFESPICISIHALLAESDGIGLVFLWWGVRFLSTLSLRRATLIR